MNRRTILLMSGCLALLAVVLMQLWQQQWERERGLGGATVDILVTTAQVPAWGSLTRQQLGVETFPERFLPPGYVPASMLNEVAGRTVASAIPPETPLSTLHLANGTSDHRLSSAIAEGDRGLTVRVGRTAFMDLVKPGDFVDVLVTLHDREERTVETRTLLQAVTVLAVGDAIGGSGSGEYGARGGGASSSKRSTDVTLAVSPQEAEMLVLAADQGELSMTLRFGGEVTSDELLEGWRLRDLLRREQVEVVQKQRDVRNCVSIARAGRGSESSCYE